VLEWAQPVAVVGLDPQLGAGAVEGQDPQVVRVKGSEVAGDLVVECHGWPRGGSTTAASPITGSLDDNTVPAISAAGTEMADFLVHSCSR
jgi:hypothetical protein